MRGWYHVRELSASGPPWRSAFWVSPLQKLAMRGWRAA